MEWGFDGSLLSDSRYNKPRLLRIMKGRRDKHGNLDQQKKEEEYRSILRRKGAEKACPDPPWQR
jgi:hypothetical protein